MHPELFPGVRAYTAFVALGIFTGIVIAGIAARRAGLPWSLYLGAQTVLALAGVIGAKVYALIEQGMIVTSVGGVARGYRYPGGILAVLLALPLARYFVAPSLSILALADIFAPAVGFAMAVVRVGCFLNGCCFGIPSNVPWSVIFPNGSPAWAGQIAAEVTPPHSTESLSVHPLQLYFAALSLGVGAFLLWFQNRKSYTGQVTFLLLVLLSGGQFLLEFLRFDRAPHIQTISFALAVLGIVGLLYKRRVQRWKVGWVNRQTSS